MRKEQQSFDLFENDSLSIGKSSNLGKSLPERQQFSLKISSNFIQEDESEYFTLDSQNMSFDDSILHKTSKQLSSKHDYSDIYPPEQINRINKLNNKIKLIIAFENQFKEQMKKSIRNLTNNKEILPNLSHQITQIAKQDTKIFQSNLSEIKFQSIKIGRVSKIPKEQRMCFLNKKDENEIKKRKYIQILMSQKDRQLIVKKGIRKPSTKKPEMNTITKKLQNYVKQYVAQIDSDYMRNQINRSVSAQLQQMGDELKKAFRKEKQYVQRLDKQINNLIRNQASSSSMINQQNVMNQIQFKTKIISKSQNLIQIVPSKTLFSFMPNFSRQKLLNLDKI